MLQEITHIEGLNGFDDHELVDDAPTNAMLVHFDVVAEEMPYLSEQAGKVIFKNFVYIFKEKHLGNFVMSRRLRDTVEWDDAEKKWVIVKLHKSQSDIRAYAKEWNSFYRGLKDGGEVGTPLTLLFRTDPARAAHYARFKINTVERLANLPEMDLEGLGAGAKNDQKLAQNYVKRVEEQAPALQVQAQLAERDSKIEALLRANEETNRKAQELEAKLRTLLEAEVSGVETAPKAKSRSRAKPKKQEGDEAIEGLE